MLVIVPLAFGGTGVANPGAQLERLAKDLLVRACSPDRKLAGRVANVSAVEAGADALAHVHGLGCASVGATEAHARAIHKVVRRIPERLVDMTGDVRV